MLKIMSDYDYYPTPESLLDKILKDIDWERIKTILEPLTEAKVNLKLFVKVRKDWRNDALFLKSIGYSKRT